MVCIISLNYFKLRIKLIITIFAIMLGSGEGHTAYFYKRMMPKRMPRRSRANVMPCPEIARQVTARQVTVMLPARGQGATSDDEEILCDPCFLGAINVALSRATDLKLFVSKFYKNQPSMITRAQLFQS